MGTKRKLLTSRLMEYSANTTIHGIKYLGDTERPICVKMFWIIVCIISFQFLYGLVRTISYKYQGSTAITVENRPSGIYLIPFPAITICPVIKIKSEFVSVKDGMKWFAGTANDSMSLDLAYLLCNQQIMAKMAPETQRHLKKFLNHSHIELLRDISPNLYDTVVDHRFPNETNSTTFKADLLSSILTNEGVCFTFNVPPNIIRDDPSLQTEYKYHDIKNETVTWDSDKDVYFGYPHYPRTVWGSGPGNGLSLHLVADDEDLNTFCQPTQIGYKILVHSPDEYPTTIEKFIPISHNTITQIKVTPKLTKTSDTLKNFDNYDRQCFFNSERKLKYFTFYNRPNCKLECLANYTLRHFGCVHFSLPRQSEQPICGQHVKMNQFYNSEEILYSYNGYKSYVSWDYGVELEYELPGIKNIWDFYCNCLPACNSIRYDYIVEMENLELGKTLNKYVPDNTTNSKIAVSFVDIFFGETEVTGTTRTKLYVLSDLMSDIGGLVGLFTGASVISIFEIIYFLIVRYA